MPPQDTNNVWPPAPLSNAGRQKSEKLSLSQRIAPTFLTAVAANVLAILFWIPKCFLKNGEIYDDLGDALLFLLGYMLFAVINIPFSIHCIVNGNHRQRATAIFGILLSLTPFPLFGFLMDWIHELTGYINKS